jgi:hypothetical protein
MPRALERVLFALVLVLSLLVILTYLVSMGLGILVVFSTTEGLTFSRSPVFLNPMLVVDVTLEVNAGVYFLFLWWVFALCFAAAWQYRESFPTTIREVLSGKSPTSVFANNLLAMPAVTSMLLIATLVLHLIQTEGGIPTGAPRTEDPFIDFLRFSRAPLVEELLFRVLPIGSFLVTYIFLLGKRLRPQWGRVQRLKIVFWSVLQPEKAKEEVGLRTVEEAGYLNGLSGAEWVIVGFTALVFGFAHYLGGWEAGKISQATLSGAAFGLAYLYYGVQAPILFHWFFNYYFEALDLSSNTFLGSISFLALSELANLFLGVLLWVVTIVFGVLTLLRVLRGKPKPHLVDAEPP